MIIGFKEGVAVDSTSGVAAFRFLLNEISQVLSLFSIYLSFPMNEVARLVKKELFPAVLGHPVTFLEQYFSGLGSELPRYFSCVFDAGVFFHAFDDVFHVGFGFLLAWFLQNVTHPPTFYGRACVE